MKKRYNDIKFKIDVGVSPQLLKAYNEIKVKFENGNFLTASMGNFSVYLNDSYLSFEVDLNTLRVCGFSGIYPTKHLKPKSINPKISESNKGILTLADDLHYQAGCGTRINFDCSSHYDKIKKMLVIGKFDKNKPYYQFLNNGYIQIDENGILKSILITNLELNKEIEINQNI